MILETGTVLNGIYRVVKLLGKGAMGNVYLVERIEDDRPFVVKELVFTEAAGMDEKTAKEIFRREAEFMRRFKHRGLPGTYGIFSQGENDYLIMDYIEGKTLEKIITSSDKPLPEDRAIGWTIELCEIIDYLHNSFEKPVVYRDLKPSNIIITPSGGVKLVDFGIARYYNPDKNTDTFSYGSPGYAAPEQYKGRGQSSPQTDVFGLGVILFQMLTLYDPTVTPFSFPAMDSFNPSVSDSLDGIIKRAIELEPLKRYISSREFKETLEKYLGTYKFPSDSEKNISEKPPLFLYRRIHIFSLVLICLTVGVILDSLIHSFPKLTIGLFFLSIYLLLFNFMMIKAIFFTIRKKYSLHPTIIELFIILAIITALGLSLLPGFQCADASQHHSICLSNLRNIAAALEMYAEDNEGHYPPSLDYLTRNYKDGPYMMKLPVCAHHQSSYGYNFNSGPDNFTIWCAKPESHRTYRFYTYDLMPEGECWPQYSPGEGIIQPY